MKRIFSFFIALLVFSFCSVSAFASSKPVLPVCQIIADCATFQTFSYSNLGLSDKEIFKRALGSTGVVLSGTTSDGKQDITFVGLDSITGLKLVNSGNSSNPLRISSVSNAEYLHFTYNSAKNIWVVNSVSDISVNKFSYLLHSPMILQQEHTADYDVFTHYKTKTIVTDDGQHFHAENKKAELPKPPQQEEPLPTEPEVPVETDKPTENKGILNWLSGFWDKFLSIFIPPEGYFDSWFTEVKNAWNSKMQNLNTLKDLLKGFFEDMNISKTDTSLVFNIPANHFYFGSPAIKTDLLQTALPYCKFIKPIFNGFIGILTLIACYKRLVKLFDH